jgi:hypothetical protein
MILRAPNNLPIPPLNQRRLTTLPITRNEELRIIKLLRALSIVRSEILGHEATAGLGNCLEIIGLD